MSYKQTKNDYKLMSYIFDHVDQWRDHRDSNYKEKWDEYERLWRGIFQESDKTRKSERSKIVSPVLQQAIETRQSEIEEAIFGQGKMFDIIDDPQDQSPGESGQIRETLAADFKRDKIRKAVAEIITLAEVYGTGIGEIIITEKTEMQAATQPTVVPGIALTGVKETDRFAVLLKPVKPHNFLIDPNASSIEDALGVAVEEFMPAHLIVKGQENEIYRDIDLANAAPDSEIEQDQHVNPYQHDRYRVLRWYGLVPRALIEAVEEESDRDVDLDEEGEGRSELYEDLVEAIVVIVNGCAIIKAEVSPHMMQDRPIVSFQSDNIPGVFWGRGTAEKAYNMQKAIDAQLRSHLDSLALTSAPMMGIDASRMPRGFKFEIYPGKSILTNGAPSETLMPLKFGETSPANVQTAELFERMLMMAAGTLDATALPGQVAGDARSGAMSMAMSAILKRYKRTLVNFQEDFLIPFVQKAVWRYMQFDPERYPSKDLTFQPISSMGMMAREYEQQQFIGLLQTLGPDSPIVPRVLRSIVENSTLSNREELMKELDEMSKPDPAAQEAQQKQQQMQEQLMQLQLAEQEAKIQKLQAETAKIQTETQLLPVKLENERIGMLTKNSEDADEFQQRAKIAELMLKEADIDEKARDRESNERIAMAQMRNQKASNE